jgi:hypothetical protein
MMTRTELIDRANAGDAEAAIRMTAVSLTGERPLSERLADAEVFARLAAQGSTVQGMGSLASILLARSGEEANPAQALEYFKEADGLLEALACSAAGRGHAVAVLNAAAANGHDAAALRLNEFLESLTPEDAASVKEEAKLASREDQRLYEETTALVSGERR